MNLKKWTEPQTVISLLGAITALMLAYAEMKRADRAETKVEKLNDKVEFQRTILEGVFE